MTAHAVVAASATMLCRAGSTRTVEHTTHSQIELVGVPVLELTLLHHREPGSAPSRLNANAMREFAVTDAMPQKNCASTQMNSKNSPMCRPVASTKICAGGNAAPSSPL